MNKVLIGLVGVLIGLFLYDLFLLPDTETKIEYVEIRTTDTTYVHVRDTVRITQLKYIYERDTIIENYQPKIRGFKETFTTMYGNATVSGELLGELNYMNLETYFKLPVVTNTIDKTKTITTTIKPSGIYLTGGINSQFQYSVGATYLKDKNLIGYEYQPSIDLHSLRVGFKVF